MFFILLHLLGQTYPEPDLQLRGNYECEASLESTGHRYMDASLDKAPEGRE